MNQPTAAAAQGEDVLAWLDRTILRLELISGYARDYPADALPSRGPWAQLLELHGNPDAVLLRCSADRRLVDLYTITKRLAERDDDAGAVDLVDAARRNLRALESVVRILAEGYGWTGTEQAPDQQN